MHHSHPLWQTHRVDVRDFHLTFTFIFNILSNKSETKMKFYSYLVTKNREKQNILVVFVHALYSWEFCKQLTNYYIPEHATVMIITTCITTCTVETWRTWAITYTYPLYGQKTQWRMYTTHTSFVIDVTQLIAQPCFILIHITASH